MQNPYYSTEIRWFSYNKDKLLSLFKSLPFMGEKIYPKRHEKKRTDYYLKTGSHNSSVKIREGRHEIKVKSNIDEIMPSIGVIEHWAKWSVVEQNNILNSIPANLLSDWITVEKLRYLKKFEISKNNGDVNPTNGFPDDGCSVELSILTINNNEVYTFGLEAFGTYRSTKDNLIDTMDFLKLKSKLFDKMDRMGYAEYLAKFYP